MIKNIIDEQEVFAINPDLNLSVNSIGPLNSKIVIVDNFYKNPDLVRKLALDIPPSYKKNLLNGLPGGRIDASYQLDHLAKPLNDIILNVYFTEEERKTLDTSGIYRIFESTTFCCNVMQSTSLPPTNPHVDLKDPYRYAAVIYLNTLDECAGGTSFYTYNGVQEGSDPGTIPKTKYITDDYDLWEMIFLAEMKYNRMVLYEQNILHTAYVKPGMFEDNIYRIAQMFFI